MNEYLFIVPIAIALVFGVMSPGPSFIYVAQTTLSKSRSHGIATSLGMGTGAVTFTLLASFGLFLVIKTVPFLYGFLKVIGGLYLLYLAYKMWTAPTGKSQVAEASADLSVTKSENNHFRSYLMGLLIQLSNPKTAIVIGGIIMAFLPAEVPPYSFWIIAIVAFVIDAGWYCIVAVALSTAKAQRFYNRFKQHINRIAGGLMAIMGTKLALNL